MSEFITIVKAVGNQMDGIFKSYHIEKIEVKGTKYTTKVKATVMNDWTNKRSIFQYEWNGSTLECINVKNEQ